MKAVLLVGSGIYRYRTSVLQRVRLAFNSVILIDHYRMRPCHDFTESATIIGALSVTTQIPRT